MVTNLHHSSLRVILAHPRSRQITLLQLMVHPNRGIRDPTDRDPLLAKRHVERIHHPDNEGRREGVERHERGIDGPFLLGDAGV